MTAKIAVIDDDAGIRRAIWNLLRSLGYAVDHFSSAEQFLEWENKNDACCVITDMKMPGMNGIELQARLLAEGCRIPMIFMTAFPEESTKTQALNAGAAGFLTKPFPQQSLVSCLTEALRARVTR
jgi:FixJ family two-component response regulator